MKGHCLPFASGAFQQLPGPCGPVGREGESLSSATPRTVARGRSVKNGYVSRAAAVSALKGRLLSAVKRTEGPEMGCQSGEK